MTTLIEKNQVYSDLYAARAAEVEYTGIFNPTPCNASYRAAIYQANAFDALVMELESNADKQREYSALHEAAVSCDAASYDLIQPTPMERAHVSHRQAVYDVYQRDLAAVSTNAADLPASSSSNNARSGVYSANLAQLCTNATAVHTSKPVSAEKSAVYENLYELANFELVHSKASSSPRAAVYAANAQIFEARPSDINTPRARAVEARQATYESVCAEHDLFATVAKVDNARAHVYAANADVLYSSPAPVRENTLASHASVYSAMPAEVFEQEAARERRAQTGYRADIYAANTELYDQVNFSLRKADSYRNAVYATNEGMFAPKPTTATTASFSVYRPNNVADMTSKTLVSSKGSVYMSAASRLSKAASAAAAAAAQTAPMSPPRTRTPMARPESLTSIKSSSSVTDLTALVQSPGLIRSSSHQDMQQLANVSLMSLADPIAEVEDDSAAPATPASPISPRGLTRAGHLGSLSAVSRMVKLGY